MTLIKSHDSITRGEAEIAHGIKATVAWAVLKSMLAKVVILKSGSGRAVFYIIASNFEFRNFGGWNT